MARPVHVLIVEDSEDDARLLDLELRRQGFETDVTRVDNGPALHRALASGTWDIVISDHNMPGFSGDDALSLVRCFDPELPFIVVSGTRGEEHAVEAMRAGANDFIVKSRLHRLAPVVERELSAAERRLEQRRIAAALEESQRQLEQAQQLEAIGRLAGGVAHDFNNLMGAILSYADLILHSLPPGDKHRDDVEEIKRAGRHAAELTRQLLAFSRQQVMHRTVLNLNEVIHDSLGLIQRLVGHRSTVELAFDPELWRIKGDRIQLEQVMLNLAANARDAMPDGGTLRITTSRVTTSEGDLAMRPPEPGEWVRLEVQDTGTGIEPGVRAMIFEPFFTTKEIGKGTGLGLATVFGIVRQSRGHIYVDSEPGHGATFTIFLPRAKEPARRRATDRVR